MKLSKLTIALLVEVLAIACLATTVSAYSNEDLKNYVTGTHKIGEKTYQLNSADRTAVINRLNERPVSDADAATIKSQIDSAKAEAEKDMKAQGVKSIYDLNAESKAKGAAKLKEAAKIAGVEIRQGTDGGYTAVDIKTGSVISQKAKGTFKSIFPEVQTNTTGSTQSNNNNSSTTVNKFAKTGSLVPVYSIVALIALVAVSVCLVKKVNAK